MTTTWLIVNIVLVVAVALVVALPAVAIPLLLSRDPAPRRAAAPMVTPAPQRRARVQLADAA